MQRWMKKITQRIYTNEAAEKLASENPGFPHALELCQRAIRQLENASTILGEAAGILVSELAREKGETYAQPKLREFLTVVEISRALSITEQELRMLRRHADFPTARRSGARLVFD